MQLAKRKPASAAAKLFQLTQVTFRSGDEYALEEEGRDEGGLSAEMFSSFFREMLSPAARLDSLDICFDKCFDATVTCTATPQRHRREETRPVRHRRT